MQRSAAERGVMASLAMKKKKKRKRKRRKRKRRREGRTAAAVSRAYELHSPSSAVCTPSPRLPSGVTNLFLGPSSRHQAVLLSVKGVYRGMEGV